jgi:carbamoyl-phosphate synthase large subunit
VQQGYTTQVTPNFISVKESVFPFTKFQGVDPILGPEMKSTGEVMGIGRSFAEAFAKAMLGSGARIPLSGTAFLSVREADRPSIVELARELDAKGFNLVATGGTAKVIRDGGVACQHVNKVKEGRPHIVDMIKNREIVFIVNTTEGRSAIADSYAIRREALMHSVCYTTTISAGKATCQAMAHRDVQDVYCLQTLHQAIDQ